MYNIIQLTGIIILCSVLGHCANITYLHGNTDASLVVDGYPAEYEERTFNIIAELGLESEDDVLSQVSLDIEIPHNEVSGVDCKTYVSGQSFGCSNVYDVHNYVQLDSINATVNASWEVLNFDGETAIVMTKLYAFKEVYKVDLGLLNITSVEANVTVKISVKLSSLWTLDKYTFKIKAHVDASTNETEIVVKKAGPILDIAFDWLPGREVEAGDQVAYDVIITHSGFSTQEARNIRININLPIGMLIQTGSASANNVPLSDSALLSGVTLSNLAPGPGNHTARFVVNLTDTVNVGQAGYINVHLTYQAPNTLAFARGDRQRVNMKPIDWSPQPGDIPLPPYLGVGGTYSLKKTFKMPKGTLSGLRVSSDYTSSTLTSIPVKFKVGRVTKPAYIALSNANNADIEENDFDITESRKKRDVSKNQNRHKRATASLKATHFIGDLVNPGVGGYSGASVVLSSQLTVGAGAGVGSLQGVGYVTFTTGVLYLYNQAVVVAVPELKLNSTVQIVDNTTMPTKVRFNVSVQHTPVSSGDAHGVKVTTGNKYFDVYWNNDFVGPSLGSPGFTVDSNDRIMTWNKSTLPLNDNLLLSYESQPANDGTDLPAGISYYNSTLWWNTAPGGSGFPYMLSASCCVKRVDVDASNIFYNYGFSVLALVVGFLFGIILIALICLLLRKVGCRVPLTSVSPESPVHNVNSSKLRATGHGLLLDPSDVKGKRSTIKDLSEAKEHDSIVSVLAHRRPLQTHRDLDERDILATIMVDESIEQERSVAMTEGTKLLVAGLRHNGDITKATEDKSIQKFEREVADLDKQNEKDFESSLNEVLKRLGGKNKDRLGELLSAQQEEIEELEEKVKDLPPKEKESLLSLQQQEHEAEREELRFQLKLEQDEETEKIRKEFAIRKRMGMKKLQRDFLDDVIVKGKLSTEQAQWLLGEHARTQATLEQLYDDEISRQRMQLEDKLARRRALVELKENQEDNEKEVADMVKSQQVAAVKQLKKDGSLTAHEAKEIIDDLKRDIETLTSKQEAERRKQEEILKKKLSERKKQRMGQMRLKHLEDLTDLQKKHQKQQTDGAVEPLSLLESRQTMLAHHRSQVNNLENDIDSSDAEELFKVRQEMATNTQAELVDVKDKTMTRLGRRGMSEDQIDKLMKKHKKDLSKLTAQQQSDRQAQQQKLQERLAQRQKDWSVRKDQERTEQEQLREHENNVFRSLMDHQVAISTEERERIMMEHEKQLVKLENSLTLTKIQQKRMLEEKLAQRRARELEALQRKQVTMLKNKRRNEESDDDEDNRQQAEVRMLRKQTEERLSILRGETVRVEDELAEVEETMMAARARALREEEEKLGVMLAQLQMEKAKELARIEEQQKAIHNLKSSLMDDLQDKGMLSDPECQRVIQIHQEEQERLNHMLDQQRDKQEKAFRRGLLRRMSEKERLMMHEQSQEVKATSEGSKAFREKLEARLRHKEKDFTTEQESRLQEGGRAGSPNAASKVKRVLLMQKHMLEMEKFRHQMEVEISQTLEEMRRQMDVRRMQMLQDQEIQFINGLVRLGKFHMSELESVVNMLFPLKSDEEKRTLLAKLSEGYKPPPGGVDSQAYLNGSLKSSLTERVKLSRLSSVPDNPANPAPPHGTARGPGKKKKVPTATLR